MNKMVSMISGQNNGVTAMVTEAHHEILQACETPDEAYEKGVRWFVFVTKRRALGNPNLAGRITATSDEIEQAPEFRMTDKRIYVPLSNGPLYFEDEAKFVATYGEFLKHFAEHFQAAVQGTSHVSK